MEDKIRLGQFYTKDDVWLKNHIIDFILSSCSQIAYDPFAGDGDLLNAVQKHCGIKELIGLDINKRLHWKYNDSLISIPHIDNAIIVTNPPYISNYSAARKNIDKDLLKYFCNSKYNDIYLIALDRMIEAQKNIVAIIPETFINSNYSKKYLLQSITILEENPFVDTETPVAVACFDGIKKNLYDVKVYKNDQFVNSLGDIEKYRLVPTKSIVMTFNDKSGWLAVRCVDGINSKDMLRFDFKENIQYDWENRIKNSSRLLTLIK